MQFKQLVLSWALLSMSFYAIGKAPFGLTWGEDISKHGSLTNGYGTMEFSKEIDDVKVSLPHSDFTEYELRSIKSESGNGLQFVEASTGYQYYKDDYYVNKYIKQLYQSGYNTVIRNDDESNKHRYWIGIDKNGDYAELVRVSLSKNDARIDLSFWTTKWFKAQNEQNAKNKLEQKLKKEQDKLKNSQAF